MSNIAIITDYYKENYDTWVKRLSGRCPSVMDAEDVVQEAFENAIKYEHTYSPGLASIATWMTHIINNTHRRMKRNEYSSTEIQESDLSTKEADEYEGDEQLFNKIKESIESVPSEGHRNILFLHLIAGYQVGEVARQVDVPVSGVKTIVRRFKHKVSKIYEECYST